jgi:phosphate transport system ATP-binding protein
LAILPPPRRRDQPTEVTPTGVFGTAVEDAPEMPTDMALPVDEAAIRVRLEEIRREAQEAARQRSVTGALAAPPPPPPSANGHVANGHVANGHVELHSAGAVTTAAEDPTTEIDLRTELAARSEGTQPGTLIAQDVNAWFGPRKVLERVSLPMRAGRVTAIIGPSGCGKSVFLRNLNRMHEVIPTARMGGVISLDGVDIHSDQMNPTEVRLKIGMVFQRPNPFPSMSIRENVLAGLKLSGTKVKDHESLVEWCLRRAGLWNEVKDRLDAGGAALSGGQQQRLCIARSLAVRPKVLLMDEPCSALDPISTRVIEETILEISKDITVVIVTHNMQQAQRVADDCAFFLIDAIGLPGKVIESGPTDQIFGNPRDARTADYVSGRFG